MLKKKKNPTQGGNATPSKEKPLNPPDEAAITDASAHNGESAGAPSSGNGGFPIVGIGASAGGLAAFEAFFSGIPADVDGFDGLTAGPGMAFVLVQHLAPDHTSMLTDLVRRYTRMKVFEVEDGMTVQINCVYIIPPNRDMAFLNGSLQLLEPSSPRGRRLPIDFFFRSLAQDQHERAICIVLSGTGSDGTLGVRAVKAEGGMVMVQNPESTEFDGMPHNAIATGMADYELPPADMAAQLIAYAAHTYGKKLCVSAPKPEVENALKKIFIILRAQVGHDFSLYKPSTVNRRIERRMAVQHIETIDGYIKFLQQDQVEVEALFRDLLIGVTNFFRDTEAMRAFEEQAIPGLFAEKPPGGVVRVWTAGCSTGEEAYSIAILLLEYVEKLKRNYTLQVFATDIDNRAIATARAGIYPASIAADITPERLARYFTVGVDGGTYRIHKSIRDLLIFSEQDVIKDPPFSKLDLISCRNLLIYMGVKLQKKVISLFHYALKPNGILFLGTSEGICELDELFSVLDRKAKLFTRHENHTVEQPSTPNWFVSPDTVMVEAPQHGSAGPAGCRRPSLRVSTEQALLKQFVPPGVLINSQGDILYLHGRTGMYLELVPGDSGINNIIKMAREGLRSELAAALHKAVATKQTVRCPGLSVRTNSHFTTVNLTVCPVTTGPAATPESSLYMVVLEEVQPVVIESAKLDVVSAGIGANGPATSDDDAHIAELKLELQSKAEHFQSVNEELESSAEELKSANEEMQSLNEELQSTNEELETSKEELQSGNEELATINTELQTKLADLSRANNDMNNLLAGTGIGTVFVDHQLRILRFTPTISAIINLIQSDVGRPVGHIVSNLVGYSRMVEDVQAVLDTLVAKEVAVQTTKGLWYTMRILPYRTIDNVIEGAVITFVDISEIKRGEETLRKANEQLRLAVVVRDAYDAITVQDLEGRIIAWNPGAVRMYGWSESEALAMNAGDRIPDELKENALATLSQLSRAEIIEPYRTRRIKKDGAVVEISMISTALMDETGKMYAIATTERAIGGTQHD